VELPTSSCHGVLHLRYYGLVGNFSRKPPGTLPGGVPEEEYYQALGYRGDVIGGYTSDWYRMSNRTPPITGAGGLANTHTHTHTHTQGSLFGTCTYGVPAKKGVPCKHMVVIVKSSVIAGLTRTGIMPHFWSTAHWQDQYPLNVECNTDISMANVKLVAHRHGEIKYCPDWTAGGKRGHPKKTDKVMTVMDHI
jgi:hypothetical protein